LVGVEKKEEGGGWGFYREKVGQRLNIDLAQPCARFLEGAEGKKKRRRERTGENGAKSQLKRGGCKYEPLSFAKGLNDNFWAEPSCRLERFKRRLESSIVR